MERTDKPRYPVALQLLKLREEKMKQKLLFRFLLVPSTLPQLQTPRN